MHGLVEMFRMNMRLLLRNKGFLFCSIIIPIMASMIFYINVKPESKKENREQPKNTWSKDVDSSDNKDILLEVKVYDYSNSKLSSYVIERLAETTAYQLSIVPDEDATLTKEQIKKEAKKTMESSMVRAVIYIPEDFEMKMSNGEKTPVTLFTGYEDARIPMLSGNIDQICMELSGIKEKAEQENRTMEESLLQIEKVKKKGTVEVFNMDEIAEVEGHAQVSSSSIAYALCFMTLSAVLSGVFVVSLIQLEKENRSYNRFRLAIQNPFLYILAKILLILPIAGLQVAIFGIVVRFTIGTNFGIPFSELLYLVLTQVILYLVISIVFGLSCNSLMGVTFLSVFIWSITCTISGVYFPIVEGTNLTYLSKIFPLRWALLAVEHMQEGESHILVSYSLIVLSFLALFTIAGVIVLECKDRVRHN